MIFPQVAESPTTTPNQPVGSKCGPHNPVGPQGLALSFHYTLYVTLLLEIHINRLIAYVDVRDKRRLSGPNKIELGRCFGLIKVPSRHSPGEIGGNYENLSRSFE
jgi:hypothetical protein